MTLHSSIHESAVNTKNLFNIDELETNIDIKLKSGKYTGFLSKLKDAQDIFKGAEIVNCDLVLRTYKYNNITLVNYFSSNGKNSFKYVVGADYYNGVGYTYIDLINDGNIVNNNIFNKYTLKHDLNITTSSKLTATAFNDTINLSDYEESDLKVDKKGNLQGFTINAGSGNDIITGSVGNDTINAGLGSYNEIHFDAAKKFGDDIINLVKGKKTKLIFEGDVSGQFKFEVKGKDALITVYGQKATSHTDSTLIVDTSKTLGTITIKNIVQKNVLGNNGGLTISSDSDFFEETDLLQEAYFNVTPDKKGKVAGTYLNNDAQSTTGVEKFNLGTGSDIISFEGEFNNDIVTLNKGEKLRLDFNDVTDSNQLKYSAEGKNAKISVYDSTGNIKGSVVLNNFAAKDVFDEIGEIYATYNNGLEFTDDLRDLQYEVFADKKDKFNGSYLNNLAKSSSKNETFNLGAGVNTIDIDVTQEGGFGIDSVVLNKDSTSRINFKGISSEDQIKAIKIGNDVILTVHDESGENELGKVKLLNFAKNPTDVDIYKNGDFINDAFYIKVGIEATSAKTYGTIADDIIFSDRTKNTFVETYNSWAYCGDNVITSRKGAADTIQFSALDKSVEKLTAYNMDFEYYKAEDSDKKRLEIYFNRTGRVVTYKQYDDNGDADVDLSKISLIDAEGTKYSFFEATSDTNLSETCGKTNNIVFSSIEDGAAAGLTFTDSKKSDYIYGSDKADGFIYQNGGFDVFNGGYSPSDDGNGSDTYTVVDLNKKTQLLVLDYDDSDAESNDTLIFANNNVDDLRLLFDVNRDGTVGESWNLCIVNKDTMTDSKRIVKELFNGVMHGSVEIFRYFSSNYSTTEHNYGYIENVFTKDYAETTSGLDMDAWTAKIASDVAAWLTYHQNYKSAFDVIETGNKVDVESLLKVYSTADYQSSIG